ncbi:MAG: hypothetical protein KGY41_08310, partial [Desulfovermiculus sp.]|nr:hypothetical protein [Desulfovermiculus sp.]
MFRCIFATCLCLVLAGCVTTQDYQSLQNKINTLERRQQQSNQQIQAKVQDLEKQFTALQDQTSHLVSNRTESMRSHQANLWSEFENLRVDVATLQGKMEQVQYNLNQLQSRSSNQTQTLADLEKQVQSLDRQLSLAGSQLGLDFKEASQSPSQKANDSKEEDDSDSSRTPQLLYEQALNAFHNREYDQAKDLWAEFASQFSEHDLVPNAYFWQGECLYQ